MPELSTRCPYCFSQVHVTGLHCDTCDTDITSRFAVPQFLHLSAEQQKFATDFIIASGSLKEIAAQYGVSYPTVRARLDRLIEALSGEKQPQQERRAAILDAVEEKRISSQEASRLLAGKGQRT